MIHSKTFCAPAGTSEMLRLAKSPSPTNKSMMNQVYKMWGGMLIFRAPARRSRNRIGCSMSFAMKFLTDFQCKGYRLLPVGYLSILPLDEPGISILRDHDPQSFGNLMT